MLVSSAVVQTSPWQATVTSLLYEKNPKSKLERQRQTRSSDAARYWKTDPLTLRIQAETGAEFQFEIEATELQFGNAKNSFAESPSCCAIAGRKNRKTFPGASPQVQ
jgi:seryl-tRNA(Sec) selenium transferase